jgi:hypothetical protein
MAGDPDGLEFEVAWIIPADQLDDEAREGRKRIGRLDLEREKDRYGAETQGGVGVFSLSSSGARSARFPDGLNPPVPADTLCGMRTCPRCGQDHLEETRFCLHAARPADADRRPADDRAVLGRGARYGRPRSRSDGTGGGCGDRPVRGRVRRCLRLGTRAFDVDARVGTEAVWNIAAVSLAIGWALSLPVAFIGARDERDEGLSSGWRRMPIRSLVMGALLDPRGPSWVQQVWDVVLFGYGQMVSTLIGSRSRFLIIPFIVSASAHKIDDPPTLARMKS